MPTIIISQNCPLCNWSFVPMLVFSLQFLYSPKYDAHMLSMGIAKQAESLCALCVRTLNVCFFVAISCKQLEHILLKRYNSRRQLLSFYSL